MKDYGKVTVFLCLIVSSMIILGNTTLMAVKVRCARSKAIMASRTAVSDICANYDSYIFEHYHILLFPKDFYGEGEAAIEERIKSNLSQNLGDEYDVNEVAITNFDMIGDDDCQKFKEQIADYMKYAAIEYGIDKVKEKTGENTGSLDAETEKMLDEAEVGDVGESVDEVIDESSIDENSEIHSDVIENTTVENNEIEDANENDNTAENENTYGEAKPETAEVSAGGGAKDPRDFTENVGREGVLLSLVLPPEMEISNEKKDFSEVPSFYNGMFGSVFSYNTSFDDYDDFKNELRENSKWSDKMVDSAYAVAYAASVFNCATNQEKNEETVLKCELEYLITGRYSDSDNLEGVCRKIIGIRVPVDFMYLVRDTTKMTLIKSISVPLSKLTVFVPEKVIRYLIAGAWSYIEAIAEVRNLLAGNKMEFVKTKDNWMTDINNIETTIETNQDCEKGLSYEDYLMILLACESNKLHYRMLDLIDLNKRQYDEKFRMNNAAVGFGVDIDITYGSDTILIHREAGYDSY